jgi:hypothetical protein
MTPPYPDSNVVRWWPPNAQPFYRPTLTAAIAASVGVMIGSVAPWASIFWFSISGLDAGSWGIITLTLGAVSALSLVMVLIWGITPLDPRWTVPLAWLAFVCGAACLATGLTLLIRILTAPKPELFGLPMGTGVGWGLWLVIMSSAILCVTAMIAALYVGRIVDSIAPLGKHGVHYGAMVVSIAVVTLIGILATANWNPHSFDIRPSESPSLPSFPSEFPTFPNEQSTTTTTTTTTPTSTTPLRTAPVLGDACDSSQVNSTTTSFSGTPLRCVLNEAGRYTWQADTGPQ